MIFNLNKIKIFFLSICYIFLPIFAYKAKPIFVLSLLGIFALLKSIAAGNKPFIFVLMYLYASSLFGVSLFNVKLFDLILLLLFIYMILNLMIKKIPVDMDVFLIFMVYIVFVYLFNNIFGNIKNFGGYIELERYIFALLALVCFSQKYFNSLNKHQLIKSLDILSLLLVMQTLVMSVCHNIWGNLNFKLGPLLVNVFNYDPSINNNETTGEARISAFFSDPNKMMCFFLAILLLRKFLSNDVKFNKFDLIYLLGTILSGARTSIIVVAIYIIIELVRSFFKNNKSLGYILAVSLILIIILILKCFNISLMNMLNNIMNHILLLFGRDNTLKQNSNFETDNRVLIWKQALNFIIQKPIFGNGLLSETVLLPYPTHNTMIQLLLDTGIIGLILYCWGILKIGLKVFNKLNFLVLICIPALFLDMANYNFNFFIIGLALSFSLRSLKSKE